MNELAPAVTLIGASLGVATILGALVWLSIKLSARSRKQLRKY